jgi:ATP-binding cassette subfamily B (MDR/TAP) protein 1
MDNPHPENRDETRLAASWKALFVFTSRKHTLTIAVVSTLTLLAGLVIPSFAIYLGKLFDSFTKFGAGAISGSQLLAEVYDGCLTLLGLGAVGWCINGNYFVFWIIFGGLQATSARKRLFRDLLKQEVRWFDMRKEGIGAFLSHAQK